MTAMTRRNALVSAGAAVVTGAVTAPLALKAAHTKAALAGEPLLAMEQEWLESRDYYETYPDQSDEADDRLFDKLLDLQYRILLTEAKSPAGVAVKLRMHCRNNCWAEEDFATPKPEDAVRGVGNLEVLPLKAALHDLERLAQEARS